MEAAGFSATTAVVRPHSRAASFARDVRFLLGIAAMLAISYGLLATVNWIPLLGARELLAMFARASANCILSIAPGLALILAVERHLPAARTRRWLALGAGTVVAAALAATLEVAVAVAFGRISPVTAWDWSEAGTRNLVWIALVAAWREAIRQRDATIAALHRNELRRVDAQARIAEAELQMLQAQIEPHFLFNSLANVRRLAQLDRAAGKAMLADLLRYLQEALPQLRQSDSTLAREAEVARAFLAVHKIRMGDRLAVEFAIPAELGAARVPPMMLLTLIENALKHGLASLPEGGQIRVAAQQEGRAVRLSVADTGRGMVPGTGTGTGLANVRARLRSLYGANASLSLEMNTPRGVVASIVLPIA